ncbi:L,D-transpeptidase family protein [Streptomyces antibioticus]|uniref:L,D-transpeptidase family protein n=1 Tax=Streptomyces antibioticus TaxID=1890 RepID=UPI003D73F2D8
MRPGGVRHGAAGRAAACALLLTVLPALSACGADRTGTHAGSGGAARATTASARIPDVGDRWQSRIPADSRQVVAVYGDDEDSARATVVLYAKRGRHWERVRDWRGHNGKNGWTPDHHVGDERSPVGVFTLSDAGGVLADPGTRLPYTRSDDFAAPRWWERSHWHDFDYVIAIDYNRVPGNPPDDPERPAGQEKGGGIWLHLDHGSGTSACVSMPRPAMEYLLRMLDPARHPVVLMGDRAALKA